MLGHRSASELSVSTPPIVPPRSAFGLARVDWPERRNDGTLRSNPAGRSLRPKTAFDPNEGVHAAIESGAVVVTANQRLARVLSRAYDERQRNAGLELWPSADVLPLDSWLRRCWRATWPSRQLLSPVQTQTLWEKIVKEDAASRSLDLLREDDAADLARRASELICDYELSDPRAEEATLETATFSRWRGIYRERCHDEGWLDPAELVHAMIDSFRNDEISPPRRVILAGFDEIPPSARRLTSVLESRGCRVEEWAPALDGESCRDGVRAVDSVEEAALVAARVRKIYEPGFSVGIVVPELDKHRSLFERTLLAELSPAAVLPGTERPEAFNISLGTPLADEPAVATALTLLRALLEPLPWEAAAALLQSPYFGDAESEWKERARLEIELRKSGLTRISLPRLAAAAEQNEARSTAAFLRSLDTSSREIRNERRLSSGWADFFARSLVSAGWPGGRKRGSREYQAVTAWQEALADLSSLDGPLGAIEPALAVERIERLCQRIFQPESRTVAPIQVLGLLETAGLCFDRLWVTGMHEDILPRPPRPHPFLPVPLQRRHALPHATAMVELEFARKLLARLRQSAPQVSFTAPGSVDGQPVRPSPLVTELSSQAKPERASGSASLLSAVHSRADSEIYDDESPPAVSAAELSTLRGGTALLTDQSNCPFRAFARHRLRAAELKKPEEDLTPLEWGLAVHRALEMFWGRVSSSTALRGLDPRALDDLVERVATEALTIYRDKLSGRLAEGERARLVATVREWIAVELERDAPFQVIAREHRTEIGIGGLPLRVQLDRIDRLADGRQVVVDYKTGRVSKRHWWGDRPVDPQLPIYSLIRDSVLRQVEAVAYAQIRPGKSRFAGISAVEGVLPSVGTLAGARNARDLGIPHWDALLAYWKRVLEDIAIRFLAGRAEVDPLPGGGWPPETCKNCPLPALCRIHEIHVEVETETGGEEEEA